MCSRIPLFTSLRGYQGGWLRGGLLAGLISGLTS